MAVITPITLIQKKRRHLILNTVKPHGTKTCHQTLSPHLLLIAAHYTRHVGKSLPNKENHKINKTRRENRYESQLGAAPPFSRQKYLIYMSHFQFLFRFFWVVTESKI